MKMNLEKHPNIENTKVKKLVKQIETEQENKIKAIVTAPVSKNSLNLAGYNFSGQTEILEKESKIK